MPGENAVRGRIRHVLGKTSRHRRVELGHGENGLIVRFNDVAANGAATFEVLITFADAMCSTTRATSLETLFEYREHSVQSLSTLRRLPWRHDSKESRSVDRFHAVV